MLDTLPAGRCLVMGVVNVTPDSFSDGGRWLDADTAIAHGIDLVADGADLVDVGGESTRPGALRIDAAEELRRVLPVIRGLVAEGVPVSVDTMRATVAEQALAAGASIVNDVSGGRADPAMIGLAASAGSPIVLMHWRGHSAEMQDLTHYDDLLVDIRTELEAQVAAAIDAGVDPSRIVVDPGLGFSKTGEQNWTVLAHLDVFVSMGHPVLVAASRKRFLGELLADPSTGSGQALSTGSGQALSTGSGQALSTGSGQALSTGSGRAGLRPVEGRDDATAALTTLAASAGAWCVRVHEPRASADAVRVVARTRLELDRPGREGGE